MNRQIYKFTFINKRGLIDKIVTYEYDSLENANKHKQDLFLLYPDKYLDIIVNKQHQK